RHEQGTVGAEHHAEHRRRSDPSPPASARTSHDHISHGNSPPLRATDPLPSPTPPRARTRRASRALGRVQTLDHLTERLERGRILYDLFEDHLVLVDADDVA